MNDVKCKGSCGKEYPIDQMKDGMCKGCLAKSTISVDDLEKSMTKIAEMAAAATPEARKQALLQKSIDGAATPTEQLELASLLKGERPAGAASAAADDLAKSLSGGDGNDDLSKAFDVAPALTQLVGRLEKALGSVGETIEKSQSAQNEINLVLAKGLLDSCKLVVQTNALVKGLEDTVESFGRQPAGTRRSAATPADVVNKSHAGTTPAEDQITKAQILDTLEAMIEDRVAKGSESFAAPCGIDLTEAVAKAESGLGVAPALMRDLAQFRATQRTH